MNLNKATNCIHSDLKSQGVNTPVYTSTANRYREYEETIYPRYFNTVNQRVIVEKLARLEKAETGLVLSSGMAAISTSLLSQLKSGDHVLVTDEIYGGTYNLIVREFPKLNITYDFVSGDNLAEMESKISDNTKVIYTETPSNPLLSIVDLKKVAEIARNNQLVSIVDNTFATPINQNPIDLGIDIVVHSGTKYLGGHSDLCFGAILCGNKHFNDLHNTALNYGGSLNATDCYLIERSLKTLAVRVEKQNSNSQKIAEFLLQHPKIKTVNYPGLPGHPSHEIAKAQMPGGFGAMLSFELSDAGATEKLLDDLKLIIPAVSLGGVETLICQPSKTSHVKVPQEEREKMGISDALLRLSIGIEDVDDLINDLKNAIG